MAKKPDKPARGDDDKVKPGEVMKMPGAGVVKAVANAMRTARAESDEVATDLRDLVAEAKKEKGIHPAALKQAEMLLNQAKGSDRGLAAVATRLAHFDYYRDVLGLTDLLQQQGQMFKRPETGETDEEHTSSGTPPGEKDLRPSHLRQPEAGTPTPPSTKSH